MAQVEVICTNCNQIVCVDSEKEANVCPNCKEAFVTEKAMVLYNKNQNDSNSQRAEEIKTKKQRHKKESVIKALKMIGKTFLFILECIGYLLYVICFIWLFFDITDGIKKK